MPNRPEYNWVWCPTGVIDMHRPERWGVVQLSDQTTDLPACRPLDEWENRTKLVDLFEAQRTFRLENGRYSASLEDLGMEEEGFTLQATDRQFVATLGSFSIDHEWRLTRE
ncbi:MAG: hypothetical protein R2845_01985 [Thermomicrobiales bacterium]